MIICKKTKKSNSKTTARGKEKGIGYFIGLQCYLFLPKIDISFIHQYLLTCRRSYFIFEGNLIISPATIKTPLPR